MVLQDGQQVLWILVSAGRRDGRGLEASFDEVPRLGVVQAVEALDDVGLDGLATVDPLEGR